GAPEARLRRPERQGQGACGGERGHPQRKLRGRPDATRVLEEGPFRSSDLAVTAAGADAGERSEGEPRPQQGKEALRHSLSAWRSKRGPRPRAAGPPNRSEAVSRARRGEPGLRQTDERRRASADVAPVRANRPVVAGREDPLAVRPEQR